LRLWERLTWLVLALVVVATLVVGAVIVVVNVFSDHD
jgi:hypothetical protein